MLRKKTKIIALASILSAGVLAVVGTAGSYTPNLVKASAPTFLRRAHFAVSNSNGLSPSNLFLNSKDSSKLNKDYEEPFAIDITSDVASNSFKVKLNSSKAEFAVANIQSMCLVNIGNTNPYAFTFMVGNQSKTSELSIANELYPLYQDAAFFVNGHFYPVPKPINPNDPHHLPGGPRNSNEPSAVYFDLTSITGDITEFTIKIDKMYLDLADYKGGISFVYGCENR